MNPAKLCSVALSYQRSICLSSMLWSGSVVCSSHSQEKCVKVGRTGEFALAGQMFAKSVTVRWCWGQRPQTKHYLLIERDIVFVSHLEEGKSSASYFFLIACNQINVLEKGFSKHTNFLMLYFGFFSLFIFLFVGFGLLYKIAGMIQNF